MAAISWASGVSGDWSTGIDWTGGAVPGPQDKVTIAAAGNYSVTIDSAASAGTLTLDAAGGQLILEPTGVLTLTGLFSIQAGQMHLAGGIIEGGVLRANGGEIFWQGGTLDGVTYEGPLEIGASQILQVGVDGLTVTGAAGSGPGEIDFTFQAGKLQYHGSPTIDHTTIDFDNGGNEIDLLDAGATLTFGPDVTINDTQGFQTIDAYPSGTIVNAGTIMASSTSGSGALTIEGALVVNEGTLISPGGQTFLLGVSGGTFENAAGGLISVSGAGSGFRIQCAWTNAGTITATDSSAAFDSWSSQAGTLNISDSRVSLYGPVSTTNLAPLAGEGNSLYLAATLDNAGLALSVGSGGDFTSVFVAGGISGGTIVDAGGLTAFAATTAHAHGGDRGGPVLDGVAWEGELNLNGGTVNVGAGGLAMMGAAGTGLGLIEMNALNSLLAFTGTQTLDNAVIDIGGTTRPQRRDAGAEIQIGSATVGGTLVLGANLTIDETGDQGGALISGGRFGQSTVINEGEIEASVKPLLPGYQLSIDPSAFTNEGLVVAAVAGSEIEIDAGQFTNQGTVSAQNGGTVWIPVAQFTNLASGVLTGGVYDAGAASMVVLPNNSTISTLDATVILGGPGALLEWFAGGQYLTIADTLTSVSAGGVLQVVGGCNYTTTNALSIAGTFQLGAGTLTAGSLAVSGSLTGFGVVATAVRDTGVIEATSGLLVLKKAVTGTGLVEIEAGATLAMNSTAATRITVAFDGVAGALELAKPARTAATITGFTDGDTIDLLKIAADSATLEAGDKLVIMDGSAIMATLQLAGDYTGASFGVHSDGHRGAIVTVTGGPDVTAPGARPHVLAQHAAGLSAAAATATGHSAHEGSPALRVASLAHPSART